MDKNQQKQQSTDANPKRLQILVFSNIEYIECVIYLMFNMIKEVKELKHMIQRSGLRWHTEYTCLISLPSKTKIILQNP